MAVLWSAHIHMWHQRSLRLTVGVQGVRVGVQDGLGAGQSNGIGISVSVVDGSWAVTVRIEVSSAWSQLAAEDGIRGRLTLQGRGSIREGWW